MGASFVEKLSIINRLGFFQSFTPEEKERIASEESHFQVYHAGDMLIRKGSPDRNLFIILNGSVSVNDDTTETVYAVLKAGEILGEVAFLTHIRRTAHVVAREPVIALKLDHTMFDTLSSPIREKLKDRIIEKLAARLDAANRELTRTMLRMNPGKEPSAPFNMQTAMLFNDAPESVLLSGKDLIRKIVANTTSLPAMPEVMLKVQQMLRLPATTPDQLAKVIETDPAMMADILKVANSAFYGFRGKVSAIRHAASLLGTRRLGELITAISSGAVLDAAMAGYNLNTGDLWRHSVAVAVTSSEIAAAMSVDSLDNAYMAGLLHDIGKIILNPYLRERKVLFDQYREVHPEKTIQEAETDILGFDHAVIAGVLCDHWDLPRSIAFAVRHHHRPGTTGDHHLATIVHWADIAVTQAGFGGSAGYALPGPDVDGESGMRIDPDVMAHATEKAIQYMNGLSGRLSMG